MFPGLLLVLLFIIFGVIEMSWRLAAILFFCKVIYIVDIKAIKWYGWYKKLLIKKKKCYSLGNRKQMYEKPTRSKIVRYEIFPVSIISTSSLVSLPELMSNSRELALVSYIIDHLPPKLLVNSVSLEELALIGWPLHGTNAGCFGVGTVAASLLSMATTFDMVGGHHLVLLVRIRV